MRQQTDYGRLLALIPSSLALLVGTDVTASALGPGQAALVGGDRVAVGVFAWDVGGYVLPKRSGETLLGTTRELGEFDPRVTPEGRRLILVKVRRISTRLGAARITGERACLRPLSLDGIPFIGEVPGWPGVFLAAGHGPEGVHFGPVTGLGLAELIVDGKSQFDLAPFSPARLTRG